MFQTYLINPVYNGFVFLIGIMPGGDVGLAIIALTLIVRVIFYPAFTANIKTQIGMQAAQPELDEINKKYKDNREELARQTLAVYKKYDIRIFSSFASLLVQIPVFIALYTAFIHKGLPEIATDILYSFVRVPQEVNIHFLGFINLMEAHNILLTAAVGGLNYLLAYITLSRTNKNASIPPERQMAHRMQKHMMLYFLPVFMAVLTYTLPAAGGLYFATTTLISLGQEWIIRRKMTAKAA